MDPTRPPAGHQRDLMEVDDDSRPARRRPSAYDIATPVGDLSGPPVSLEGESRGGDGSRRGREDELRENARRSRPRESTLERENSRLRALLQRSEIEIFELHQSLDHARFETNQMRDRMQYFRDRETPTIPTPDRRGESRSYHPYPRPDFPRFNPPPPPRESSVGPDRSIPSRHFGQRAAPIPSSRVPTERQASPMVIHPSPGASNMMQRPVTSVSSDPYANLEDDDEYEDEEERDRRETNRVFRAQGRAQRRNRQPPPQPKLTESTKELHGDWANVPIDTEEQWTALRDAIINGDDDALRYCMYLNTKHQIAATRERTAGVRALMTGFNWLIKSDQVSARYSVLRTKNRKARSDQPTSTNSIPLGPPPDSASGSTSVEPVAPSAVKRPRSSSASRPGPEAPLKELVNWWGKVRVPHWPPGMKLYNEQLPTDGMLGTSLPLKSDVAAIRVLLETAPVRRHQDAATKLARANYRDAFINLFSVYELYREYVTRLGAPAGNRLRSPFPFDTRNLELPHVALWLHEHGLIPGSSAVENIERWAVEVRERSERPDSDGIWPSFPRGLRIMRETHASHFDNLRINFAYPPISRAAGTRGPITSAETLVAKNRRDAGLSVIPIEAVSPDDELQDTEMAVIPAPTSQDDSNSGPAVA